MAVYDREKILYLIDKKEKEGGTPFHISTKEYISHKTTLPNYLQGMERARLVTRIDPKDMPKDENGVLLTYRGIKSYGYLITDKGRMALCAMQAQTRSDLGKPLDGVIDALLPVLKREIGVDATSTMLSMLELGEKEKLRKEDLDDDALLALKALNTMGLTFSFTDDIGRFYRVTPTGLSLGEAAKKMELTPQKQEAPVAQERPASMSPELREKALLMGLCFADDFVMEVDNDHTSSTVNKLITEGLITEHARDDAFVYYIPTEAGAGPLKAGVDMFKKGVDLSMLEYNILGDAALDIANKTPVMSLHWDDMHEKGVSLMDAINDAMDLPTPRDNFSSIEYLDKAVTRSADLFSNPPSANQLKSVVSAVLENEGIDVDSALIDQAVTSYRMTMTSPVADAPRPDR